MLDEHFLETDETATDKTTTEEVVEKTDGVEKVDEKTPEIWETYNFPDKESFEKSFESNRSMVGKQSNVIGEDRAEIRKLTKEVEQLRGQMVKPAAEPEYDPDDPSTLVDAVVHKVQGGIQKQAETQKAESAETQKLQAQQNEYNEAIQTHLVEFQKNNPDISPEKLMEVGNYADSLGLQPKIDGPNILQAAFDAMLSNGRRKIPTKEEIKEADEKIKTLPKKADGVRSTVKSEIDMSDWNSLTDKERESSLMDAPMG